MFQVGQKVKTRNGRNARVLCVDLCSAYSVVAAVMSNNVEVIYYYDKDGKINGNETPMDLIYERENDKLLHGSSRAYSYFIQG